MKVSRGDVVLVDFPFAAGRGAKVRPAVVVQNDRDNGRTTNTVVAMVTSRTHRASQPTQVSIEIGTPDGQQTGLVMDSVVNSSISLRWSRPRSSGCWGVCRRRSGHGSPMH